MFFLGGGELVPFQPSKWLVVPLDFGASPFWIKMGEMVPTLTHAAAVVAGLAMVASLFIIGRKRLLPSLAAAVGLCILAAVLISIIA
jgi:hypothetical protein